MSTELINKYLEFRKTATKIGLGEALVQFRSIGPFDWKFEVLRELFYITSQVQTENSEKAHTAIRAAVKLLNNEIFLSEHNQGVIEMIGVFEDIEYQESNMNVTRLLVEGVVYLVTRCALVKCLAKSNEIARENVIDQLLLCVRRLNNRFLLQLSETTYALVEEIPEYASLVRLKLSEMQILPDVIIKITALHCDDEIELLNGVFYQMPSWFLAQTVSSRQYFLTMKDRIVLEIKASYHNNDQVRVASAIRALIGINGFFGIKLGESEVDVFISILYEAQSERIVQLLLCLVLVAADQFLKRQVKKQHRCRRFYKHIVYRKGL
ncbi:unnamed protein product [Rhizopus stolonifer]